VLEGERLIRPLVRNDFPAGQRAWMEDRRRILDLDYSDQLSKAFQAFSDFEALRPGMGSDRVSKLTANLKDIQETWKGIGSLLNLSEFTPASPTK